MARRGRAVICLNSAHVYSSIKEAASDLRLDPAAVQRAAAGSRARAGNYFFMYADELETIPFDFRIFCDSEILKRVHQIETGKEPGSYDV